MKTVNIYLIFNGNCGEAFQFYKNAFGGDFEMIAKFGEMPPQEGQELSEADKEKIMHVKFPISAETVLYGSDSLTEEQKVTFGNNFSVSINVDSRKDADELFANGKYCDTFQQASMMGETRLLKFVLTAKDKIFAKYFHNELAYLTRYAPNIAHVTTEHINKIDAVGYIEDITDIPQLI